MKVSIVKRLNCSNVVATAETDEKDKLVSDDVTKEWAMMQIADNLLSELDVSPKYAIQIQEMVQDYKPICKIETNIKTKIVLTDDVPIYERARRLAPLERKVLDEQVTKWLSDGIIRPSQSEYASPVVLVKKKNGCYRVCIDYRRLNRKTV